MAVIALDLYKVVVSGLLLSEQDWSTSFWMSWEPGTAPTQNNVTTDAGSIGNLINTWWGHVGLIVDNQSVFNKTSLYYYPANSAVSTLIGYDTTHTASGSDTATANPTQLAQVLSLRSSTPGRSGRGRMYLPATGRSEITAGQYSASSCTTLATNTAGLFTALNASVLANGSTPTVCVASFTKAHAYPIVTVEVNSKIESQRRREDKIVELYNEQHVV